jgi:hypothetical protein
LGEREVRVTTCAEFDAALRSADRIVVEGDAGLVDYAAGLAGTAPRDTSAETLRPPGALEREAHIVRMSRAPRLWPWVAGAIAFAAAAGAALLLEHFSRPGRLPATPPAFNAATLTWPAVAVILILALYIVARRASPSDTRRAWQVSEKSAGRVVITRVRGRAL